MSIQGEHKENITDILHKHLAGELLSEEETAGLNAWLQASPHNRRVLELMSSDQELGQEIKSVYKYDREKMWERLEAARRPMTVVRGSRRTWWRYAAAAAILTISGTLYWQYKTTKPSSPVVAQAEILPGGKKATLTLGDGQVITLDSAGNQVLTQGQTTIRQDNGELQYTGNHHTSAITWNTLTTPRGGQFRVTLPDGSQVWLNAATTLRYPVAFPDSARIVELTGEAYFEVATINHNSKGKVPFKVNTAGMTVEVLGTHFNVMAYREENRIATTLLEGSVRLLNSSHQLLIKPGQQGILKDGNTMFQVSAANIEETMSWKDGYFWLTDNSLPAIMRQLSRWYDVDIQYEGTPPDVQFGGIINRELPLSAVLAYLAENGVKTRISGRTVTVLP